MTAPADPIDPGTSPLQLRSTIDAAALERVRVGLEAVLQERLASPQMRAIARGAPQPLRDAVARTAALRPRGLKFMRWCAMLGLMVSLSFTASGGLEWDGYRLDLMLASYFVAALALSVLLPNVVLPKTARITKAILAWRPKPWTRVWRYFARTLTDRTLKAARAAAPFDAQYDIDGGCVTYTRIRGEQAKVEWTRPLQGWHVQGDGFTVLFQDTASLKLVVILHEPCERFDALLALHGVQPLPRP